MSIDNSISWARIKRVLSLKTVLIAFLIVTFASTVLYITIENSEKSEILIWLVTTDTDTPFSDKALDLINEYASGKGINKVVLTRRHPEDRYFDAVMSTGAFYNCDVFIMTEEMAKNYADLDMFLPLSTNASEGYNYLLIGEDSVGIPLDDNYYLLINAKTDIDLEIIYDIFDILITK